MDKRIGNSHMDVPGHDGRLDMAVITKDTAAVKYSQSLEKELSLLKKAIEINNNINLNRSD